MQEAGTTIFGSDRSLMPPIRWDKKLYPKNGNDNIIRGFSQKAMVR